MTPCLYKGDITISGGYMNFFFHAEPAIFD